MQRPGSGKVLGVFKESHGGLCGCSSVSKEYSRNEVRKVAGN